MDWNETAWSDREHGTVTEREQDAMNAYVLAMRWNRGEALAVYEGGWNSMGTKYLPTRKGFY